MTTAQETLTKQQEDIKALQAQVISSIIEVEGKVRTEQEEKQRSSPNESETD